MTTGIVMLLTPAATVAVPPPHSRGWYWTWVQGDLHVVGTRLLTDRTTPRDKGCTLDAATLAEAARPPW
ncbi:MAG: hypothetical protein OXC96_09180 [Cyanobacteria bacterium MAG CAR1_bin_15]|nr:hypothetical protein [Cyanobacteria bacterium MAG CAR1_bin_15]